MRISPRPVMMRLGHRLTGGRPPPDDFFWAGAFALAERCAEPALPFFVDAEAFEAAGRAAETRLPAAARDARSPARPVAPPGALRLEVGRLGEFLRWSATHPRYRARGAGSG